MTKRSFLQTLIYQRTLKFWLVVLFVLPGIPFVLGTVGLLLFSYFPWPMTFDIAAPVLANDKKEMIILIHGKDDTPDTWPAAFATELKGAVLTKEQQVESIDWYEYSTNLFRCANNGRRIGQQLGKQLAVNKALEKVHLIGHSAGSFLAYGLCESLRQHNPDVLIHTTYLDPLGPFSGFQWHYGTHHFGTCADISDAYIDVNDRVPGSNVPVENAHTFDVSALRTLDKNYRGTAHMWPIEYYRQSVLSGRLPFWLPDDDVLIRYPRHKQTVLEGE